MSRRKARRGGARNTGQRMPGNTSGVGAIGFRREGDTVYVLVAAEHRRTRYSVTANGVRGACERAVDFRLMHGLPADSVNTVMRALREYRRALPCGRS